MPRNNPFGYKKFGDPKSGVKEDTGNPFAKKKKKKKKKAKKK